MTLPEQRWLRATLIATAVVFGGVAIYVFAVDFSARLHADDAVMVLLADKALHVHSPVAADWYYANGDVWVFGPHLFALLPVGILGLGLTSLVLSLVLAFVLQVAVALKAYLRLCGERWIAALATMTTLMAWSVWHVDFNYVQAAYGLVTVLYLVSFTGCAALGENTMPRWWRFIALGALVVVIAIQNPTRAFVYGLAPVLVGCAWPWLDLPLRRRLAIAATASGGWLVAFLSYKWLVLPAVQFSVPNGHVSFALRGLGRIKDNLVMLERGIVVLCGGGDSAVRAVPSALLLLGAFVLVVREVVTSRAFTALRFVCTVVLAQLGGVFLLVLVGNLLTDVESTRYLLPGWLSLLGLAAILAARSLAPAVHTWVRRLAVGWLVLVPVAALAAVPDTRPADPITFIRPDSAELRAVADELVRRDLSAGFAINIAANLLTMYSHGAAMTCPLMFRNALIPHRWLADTRCFSAARLPEKFYVVVDQNESERSALRQTLPAELEKFSVGDTYEVYVYRTATASLAWLDLPIPDGDRATFPMRLSATNLQLVREKVALQGEDLVGTGEPGTVVYGPYVELPPGDYEAVWFGHGLGGTGQLTFTALANFGKTKLATPVIVDAAKLSSAPGELVRFTFTLTRSRGEVEFPVDTAGGARISLHELVIERKR